MNQKMKIQKQIQVAASFLMLSTFCMLTGCSASPAGLAIKIVGQAVDSADVATLKDELVGKPVSAADAKFGEPIECYTDVKTVNRWRVYPVKLDVMDKYRYVIEDRNGKIVAITKTTRMNDPIVTTGRLAIYKEKAMGKTPKECQNALERGPAVLSLKSEKSGDLVQLYNAQIIQGFGPAQYIATRFDRSDKCCEVRLITAAASTKDDPAQN